MKGETSEHAMKGDSWAEKQLPQNRGKKYRLHALPINSSETMWEEENFPFILW